MAQRRTGRPTLRTIADAAGVSVMTVSNAVRGKTGDLSPETRERILAIAEELKYRPNLLVQGMRTGLSKSVGVMVSIGDAFGAGLVRGVHNHLAASGWLPILHWPTVASGGTARTRELGTIHALLDRRVDGIVLLPSDESVEDVYFEEVWERGIPMVTIDRPLPKTRADFAGTDDVAAGKLAADHLGGLGLRHVALLTGPDSVGTYQRRSDAFLTAVENVGLRCDVIRSRTAGYGSGDDARRALDTGAAGFFLTGGLFAADFCRAVTESGRRLGSDLAAVTVSSPELVRGLDPNLAVLRQDAEAIGETAASLLLDRIRGRCELRSPVHKLLPPVLEQPKAPGEEKPRARMPGATL